MRIEVTQADIDKGKIGDAYNCAIAVALKKDGKFARASVSTSEIVVMKGLGIDSKIYFPGGEIRQWIGRFDSNPSHVKPFAFELPDDPNGDWLKPIEEEETMIPANFPVMVKETANVGRSEEVRQG